MNYSEKTLEIFFIKAFAVLAFMQISINVSGIPPRWVFTIVQ
jgi:hypothetical protein